MTTKVSCPSCGHIFKANDVDLDVRVFPTLSDSAVWAQPNDVTLLQEEVSRLDGIIRRLNEERATYLRWINSAQASTRQLPSEVLSTIFQFACEPGDEAVSATRTSWPNLFEEREVYYEEDFQLELGAVSHHWRQVVWSTPQLWTALSMQINRDFVDSNISFLGLYFQNNRGLPMTLRLDCRWELDLLEEEEDVEIRAGILSALEPIRASVFDDNAHKIRKLIATGLLPEWLSSLSRGLPRCELLALLWPDGATWGWDNYQLSLTESPCLRFLLMKDFIHFSPSQTITSLELYNMPAKAFAMALVQCPNLVRYETYGSPHALYRAADNEMPSLNRTIVHENLLHLRWIDRSATSLWARAFLAHFRFPRLQVLLWFGNPEIVFSANGDSETTHLSSALSGFFSELPVTLNTLTLFATPYSFSILKAIFGTLLHLENLHLVNFSPSTASEILGMIGHPVAALLCLDMWPHRLIVDPSVKEGPRVLTALKLLSVDTETVVLMPRIVQMLEKLHAARMVTGPFCLKLPPSAKWNEYSRCRLKELVTQGFELVILQGSETLDLETFEPLEDEDPNIFLVESGQSLTAAFGLIMNE